MTPDSRQLLAGKSVARLIGIHQRIGGGQRLRRADDGR
jgi:hypothetical protein